MINSGFENLTERLVVDNQPTSDGDRMIISVWLPHRDTRRQIVYRWVWDILSRRINCSVTIHLILDFKISSYFSLSVGHSRRSSNSLTDNLSCN